MHVQMRVWMDENVDGRKYGWMDGNMDGNMNGWMEIWMDGCMDGCIDEWMYTSQVLFLSGIHLFRLADITSRIKPASAT